jgi:hypothetical protein
VELRLEEKLPPHAVLDGARQYRDSENRDRRGESGDCRTMETGCCRKEFRMLCQSRIRRAVHGRSDVLRALWTVCEDGGLARADDGLLEHHCFCPKIRSESLSQCSPCLLHARESFESETEWPVAFFHRETPARKPCVCSAAKIEPPQGAQHDERRDLDELRENPDQRHHYHCGWEINDCQRLSHYLEPRPFQWPEHRDQAESQVQRRKSISEPPMPWTCKRHHPIEG